jgi:hemerythrin-like metal-binding protein
MINWNDDLSVGIDSIDAQHKVLIKTLNQIASDIGTKDTEANTKELVGKLGMYIKEHFSYEEKLFEKYEWEGKNHHKNQHELLKKKVVEIISHYSDSTKAQVDLELVVMLHNWINDHINKEDKEYSDFLISHGVK